MISMSWSSWPKLLLNTKMATTIATEGSDRKRQHAVSNDGDDEEEWIGPMPTEAVKEKKRKGNISCIACGRIIDTSKEQWVECESCANSQHIACQTGIPLTLYTEAMKSGCNIIWKCGNCSSNGAFAVSFVGLPVSTVTQALPETDEFPTVVTGEPGEDVIAAVISNNEELAAVSTDQGTADRVTDAGNPGDADEEIDGATNEEGNESVLSYLEVQKVEETSDAASSAARAPVDDRADVSYSILEGSSQRQKPKLIDSRGYSYTIRRKTPAVTSWRCSLRNANVRCYANVLQIGDVFTFGPKLHVHEGNKEDLFILPLRARIKEIAATEVLRSSGSIVNEIIVNEVGPSGILPGLPNKSCLVRQANRHRQKMQPDEPKNLKFDLLVDIIPSEFVRGDVHVKGRRHIVMASNSQLMNLALTDTWYIHETDKLVKHPFTHLLTISCYVKKGKLLKLLPFCFVLMSGRKSKDYKEVFRVIKTLAGDSIGLTEIFLHFDKALWKSVGQVFASALLRGYVQEWKHSIWSKIAKVDLTWTYLKEKKVHAVLKQLMALAFLPPGVIPTAFNELRSPTHSTKVNKVFDHLSTTWLQDKLWPPETWSVYQHSVCSHSELEAWHPSRGKAIKRGGYHFYKLVKLLHQKGQSVTPRIRLVSEANLKEERGGPSDQQSLLQLWEQYDRGIITTHQLLKESSELNFK